LLNPRDILCLRSSLAFDRDKNFGRANMRSNACVDLAQTAANFAANAIRRGHLYPERAGICFDASD
jgi:hypothetical protein